MMQLYWTQFYNNQTNQSKEILIDIFGLLGESEQQVEIDMLSSC